MATDHHHSRNVRLGGADIEPILDCVRVKGVRFRQPYFIGVLSVENPPVG